MEAARSAAGLTEADREALLAVLAGQLRAAYTLARREYDRFVNPGKPANWGATRIARYDGGYSSTGAFYPNLWRTLAEACLRHDYEPGVAVRGLFLSARDAGTGYEPPALRSVLSPDLYPAMRSRVVRDTDLHLRMQKQAFGDQLSRNLAAGTLSQEQAIRQAIRSPDKGFTPLYQYSVLRSFPAEQAYCDQSLWRPALMQYLAYPDVYQEVWGKLLPGEIVVEGAGKVVVPSEPSARFAAGASQRRPRRDSEED